MQGRSFINFANKTLLKVNQEYDEVKTYYYQMKFKQHFQYILEQPQINKKSSFSGPAIKVFTLSLIFLIIGLRWLDNSFGNKKYFALENEKYL